MKKILSPRDISGFADYNEAENVALSSWVRQIEDVYRAHGFSRLLPRPLELREVLLARGGMDKQIFGISRLPQEAPTDLALPFDRTVPLANWTAKHAHEICFPYKRFDIGYSFRGERAQAGRFQGFFQADVDIIGPDLGPDADAECIAVLYRTLLALGLGELRVSLNHIGLAKNILRARGVREEQLGAALAAIDKIGKANSLLRRICGPEGALAGGRACEIARSRAC
jgi:histidyl-tRNA synthetase